MSETDGPVKGQANPGGPCEYAIPHSPEVDRVVVYNRVGDAVTRESQRLTPEAAECPGLVALANRRDQDTRTPTGREAWIKYQEQLLFFIREDRGKAYGSPDDTLGNIANYGWVGAALHVTECHNRMQNMVRRYLCSQVDPDWVRLRDALDDMTNYLHYFGMLLDREGKP